MNAIAAALWIAIAAAPDDTATKTPIEVKETAAPAFLGIAMRAYTKGDVRGVQINEVIPGACAEKAGLMSGDLIINLDGRATTSPDEVIAQISGRRVGETTRIGLLRGDKGMEIDVLLGGRPLPSAMLLQKDPPRTHGGTFKDGGGTVNGRVDTGGNYIVEGSPTITENLTQRWTGVLDLQIDPDTKAYIKVGGRVTVEGLFYVNLIGRKPRLGDRFEVISNAKSVEGRFAETMLPKIEDGLEWQLDYDDLAAGVDGDGDGKADVTLSVVKASD